MASSGSRFALCQAQKWCLMNLDLIKTNKAGIAPIKVSQLVGLLKSEIEQRYRLVCLVGEISSFKQWRSGHCYFDIKDEEALIPAVMFRPHFAKVPFKVSDGLQVLISGRVSIYPANARLQLIVESMEPLGQGALALAFEQLKTKLLAEGLFDLQHKKALKYFNQNIGLVSSPHGAALQDIIRIIKSRMPGANILLAPVRVQGLGAKEEIAEAISRLDRLGGCDLIIIGRGGGSLEDLWAFNEELVARAIFACQTPIISAVGHETDISISDLVADLRAATPTHAAQMACLELAELLNQLAAMRSNLFMRCKPKLDQGHLLLAQEKRRLADPRVLLYRHWQRLDEFSKRLANLDPSRQLRLKKELLFQAKQRLLNLKFLVLHRQLLTNYVIKLEALSPLKVLGRGFSIIEANHCLITCSSQLEVGQLINIRLQDGSLKAQVLAKD